MKKIIYVLPHLSSYILPLISGLAEHCELLVIYSKVSANQGFGNNEIINYKNICWKQYPTIKLLSLKYQFGVIYQMLKEKPDGILIGSTIKNINYWILLFLAKLFRIKIFSRGQGLFKVQNITIFHKFFFKTIISLSYKYICYTQSVLESIENLTERKDKLEIDYNYQYNQFALSSENKTGDENDIMFVGRLREGSGLKILIQSVENLRQIYPKTKLHIIGGGQNQDNLIKIIKNKDWIHYYGIIYDDQKIQEISKSCKFSCFPGAAGLSVVHMMSYSLPILTHYEMKKHQGPEPSYIKNNFNGWFYGKMFDQSSLNEKLIKIFSLSKDRMKSMQNNAYQTFLDLSTPPFHIRLLKILEVWDKYENSSYN